MAMPFELHTDQNQVRLSITEPISRRNHARITLTDGREIIASFKGGRIDGALLASPVERTLSAPDHHILSARMNALKKLFAATVNDIRHCNEMIEQLQGADDPESISRLSNYMQTHTSKHSELTHIVRLQHTPPVLSDVRTGEPLFMLVLADERTWDVHELGVVSGISILK